MLAMPLAGSQHRAQDFKSNAGFSVINWGSAGWSRELSWKMGLWEELAFYGVLRARSACCRTYSDPSTPCTPCEQKGTLLRNSALSDVP